MRRRIARVALMGLTLLSLISFFSPALAADSKSNADKNRSRLEELFIWKMSDSLNLTSKEEESFSQVLKKIRQDKSQAESQLGEILQKIDQMNQADKTKSNVILLEEYKKILREYQTFQVREVQELEHVLGVERVTKYLVLKEKLLNRLKDVLTETGKSHASKSPMDKPRIVHDER